MRKINFSLLLWGTLAVFSMTAYAPSSYAQASGEDDELAAAERALLEGLASRGTSPFSNNPEPREPASAELKPATYSLPVNRPETNVAPGQNEIQEQPIQLPRDLAPKRIERPATETIERVAHEEVPQAEPVESAVTSTHQQHTNPLKRELEASQKRVAELERQLEEVKGQLSMAETELSRLATINEARARASFGRAQTSQPVAAAVPSEPRARLETPHIEPTPAGTADLQIATVSVDKAELRLGPGKNHSALMTVAKGSRLAVEARQGEWLRVFAPNGQRAWVQSKLVAFGSKSSRENGTSSVRVRGYSGALEDDAFKRVQSLTGDR